MLLLSRLLRRLADEEEGSACGWKAQTDGDDRRRVRSATLIMLVVLFDSRVPCSCLAMLDDV